MIPNNPNPLSRLLFLGLGLICLGLGFLGFVLPGMPGTPFLLLAAACFAKSSPRLHNWLLENEYVGPMIKNWQESRTIPRRSKRIALLMVFMAGGFSLYTISSLYFKAALIIILTIPVTILLRLKETESLVPVENGEERE